MIRAFTGDDGRENEEFLKLAEKEGATFDWVERVWKRRGAVLIPDHKDLRVMLIATAHSWIGGHRRVATTSHILETVAYWPGMKADIKEFVTGCLHCLEKRSHLMARPFGQQIMPHKRNQIVSFDYLHLGPSEQGVEKILIVTDKLTSFTMMFPGVSESEEHAATSLISWMSLFGPPKTWLSDQSTGFKNEVIKKISKHMGVGHHFVTAHSHWANGKQERLNLTVGNIFRTLLSENGLAETHWISLVPIVQMIINHTPVESLSWLAPVTAMTGIERSNPIDCFFDPNLSDWQTVKLDEGTLATNLAKFQREMAEREVTLHEFQEQKVAERQKEHQSKSGVKHLELAVGDFVMVLEAPKHKIISKLAKRWVGPAKVIGFDSEAPEHVVKIEYMCPSLTKTKIEFVHVSRLRFFDLKEIARTAEIQQHAESTVRRKWIIKSITDLKKVGNQFNVEVNWEEDQDGPTWEPLAVMCQDVPEIVKDFVENKVPSGSKHLVSEVKQLRFYRKLVASRKGGSVAV
jgi:hypothetical protein